ncbi:aldehyde dehydrogenase family protein, partial [Xanthomonas sacchari]
MHSTEPLAAASTWSERIFNGEWVAAQGGVLEVIEPGSGTPLHRVGQANAADVAAAVAQAREAQRAWAATPPRERAAVF